MRSELEAMPAKPKLAIASWTAALCAALQPARKRPSQRPTAPRCLAALLAIAWIAAASSAIAAPAPDIASITPDLIVPPMETGEPAPGRRVRQVHPDHADTEVHHALYLPTDWKPGRKYPVIVEFAGNGPYSNKFGDISTGRVEGSKLGYGISAGQGFIWVCLPYLNNAGDANVTRWWGDPPTYNPQPTIDYTAKTLDLQAIWGRSEEGRPRRLFPRRHRLQLPRPSRQRDCKALARLHPLFPLRWSQDPLALHGRRSRLGHGTIETPERPPPVHLPRRREPDEFRESPAREGLH